MLSRECGDGSVGSISSAGIDYSLWSDTTGLVDPDGAVYWQFSTKGPARYSNAEVVIAQLTVPTGTCFSGSVNAQGHTIEHSPNPTWKAEGIHFKGGPSRCVSAPPAPTLKPTGSLCRDARELSGFAREGKCARAAYVRGHTRH